MDERHIRQLLERVRRRWRRLMTLRAAMRGALAASLVLAVALVASRWIGQAPFALAAIGVLAILLVAGAIVGSAWPLRRTPSDQRVARFIEEAEPSLDDRLASAVALTTPADASQRPAFADAMLADASRRVAAVDPRRVVPSDHLRRAGFQAAAAVLLFVAIAFAGRATARQSFDAVSLSLFPSRTKLDVAPGDARIKAGAAITIDARLIGNTAPVSVRLLRSEGDRSDEQWRATDMAPDSSGGFHLSIEPNASFKYRVSAGAVLSRVYTVTVARPPRVTRIDLDYTFPKELGLPPRVEEDTGDIYAPAGSDVRVRVHTDREAASGVMTLTSGTSIPLVRENANLLAASVTVSEDGSYRLALTDAGGLESAGDTEYFIRTLQDRPPDVHVLHPARDREVTRLEEVDVQARADDDFGVASMDLVYAVNGGPQKVAPLAIPRQAVSATGTTTLYLEDLKVAPGDFVSYYVRARDIGRGKRSSETKSDLFFLQVRPFDQEFTLADGQGAGGGGRQLDDLVQAQKDIVVSTWKLDRRNQAAGASSPDDVKAVARAETELKARVEETASAFRESTMRDPRARGGSRLSPPRPGEEDMTAAALAMGKAAATLGELKTAAAVPPEMDALNHLLQAQADIKQRQVQTQQAGSGNGQNRSNLDLSNLFDRELQRQQRTNYESKSNADTSDDTTALDKVRDLARRQDELNERQKQLARRNGELPAEEMKRELEQLTREQSDLRQKAEELAQSLASQSPSSSPGSQSQKGSQGSTGSPGSTGSAAKGSQGSESVRAAAEAMSRAAGSLRQQNPSQASQQGAQAADRLRSLADQLEAQSGGGADARRRALGDLQLESRQLADAQRQVASSLDSVGRGAQPASDTMRRLAGEEEQLAARAGRVQQELGRQAAAAAGASSKDGEAPRALAGASRDFERQRVGERMQQAAAAMRAAASQAQQPDSKAAEAAAAQADAGRQAARDLDRLADLLASASAPQDEDSRKLADARARADALRAEIDRMAAQMKDAKPGADVARLRDDYARALQQAQQLLEQLKRDDPTVAQQAGPGFTFEGQGMTLSAPGTEAFKQDFAKWDQLRLRATDALSKAETSIDRQLQAKAGKDRLSSGVDDRPPAGYEPQVSSYFKALADRKR